MQSGPATAESVTACALLHDLPGNALYLVHTEQHAAAATAAAAAPAADQSHAHNG